MPTIIDITPTAIQFLYNGKIHQIKEIMESGDGLMITTEAVKEVFDELLISPKGGDSNET